jgi:hypothetical protein
VDNTIKTLPDLINWTFLQRKVYDWRERFTANLECLRTIDTKFPIKPDGNEIKEDDKSDIRIVFRPHWGGEKATTDAALSYEDYGNKIVYIIYLPINSSWIGLEESIEKQLEKSKNKKINSIWMERFQNLLFNQKRKDIIKKFGPKLRDLLLHEVTHLMDKVEYFESKHEIMQKAKYGYKPLDGTLKSFKQYFNHNIEYNAYYISTLSQVLEKFDKEKRSDYIIKNFDQEQFIEACMDEFKNLNSAYIHSMSNSTKRKIIQRLGRWYNDVLLPEYRAKGKTSFSTKLPPIKKQKAKPTTKPTVEENILKELESVWP